MYNGEDIWGSKYKNICISLYNIVKNIKPTNIVELGVGTGACAAHMGKALQDEKINGKLVGFDTFSEFNSKTKKTVLNNIKDQGLEPYIELYEGNVYDTWLKNPTTFDMIYIDLNNTWESLHKIITYNNLYLQFKNCEHVYIEGGSSNHPRTNTNNLDKFHSNIGKKIFEVTYISSNHASGPCLSKIKIL